MSSGKARVIKTLKREPADRPAWLPFVGCHGGFLIGQSATAYLKSCDLLMAGLKRARDLYRPDALPIAFDLQIEAVTVIDQAGGGGFVLAPGCDLPYATPPANLAAVAEVVHDAYAREVVRTARHAAQVDAFDDVAVPDYSEADAVVLDVITQDSTSCAPCQYMMEAVARAVQATAVRTYVNEHKIKVRQGLGMMQKLGVKNLPTICIDGEVVFASIIPDQRTLVAAIEKHAEAKRRA